MQREFTGRLKFDGFADVTISLQDYGLGIAGAFGEVLVSYESIARSKLLRGDFGAIKIAMAELQILLDIDDVGDKLALFARLEEWMAGLSSHPNSQA